jgi:hypothetical protein
VLTIPRFRIPNSAVPYLANVHRVIHKALTVAVEWNLLSRNPAAVDK